MELDDFDIGILSILQKSNITSQQDIGNLVGLSTASVQRRIKRMRETGVITADVSLVNREIMGHPITIFVEIILHSDQIASIDAAKKSFASAPEVQQCYYVTGESDFVLVIVVPSMKEYEQLTRRLFFSNKNIKHFRTIVAMGIVKSGLEIPLRKIESSD